MLPKFCESSRCYFQVRKPVPFITGTNGLCMYVYTVYIYGIDISFYHQSLSYENFAAHQTSAAQRSPAYSTIQVDGRWLASMPWVMDNSPLEQRSSNPGKLQTNVETHGKTDGLPYKNDPQCWADSTSMFVYKVP